MEVVTMMPYRLPDSFGSQYDPNYLPYHDMCTSIPVTSTMTTAPPTHPYPHPQNVPRSQTPADTPASNDETHKPSLPSISNLLGIADADKTTSSSSSSKDHSITPQSQYAHGTKRKASPEQLLDRGDFAPRYVHTESHEPHAVHVPTVSPTPLTRVPSSFEQAKSPSSLSSRSSQAGASGQTTLYAAPSLNNLEPHHQRAVPAPTTRHSLPPQPAQSMYSGSPYAMSQPYSTSPSGISAGGSYYSTESPYQHHAPYHHQPQYQHHQRPLPSSFPPQPSLAPPMSQSFPPTTGPVGPSPTPWEHHHYLSASSQASFPGVQDRYVCPTCKKAFSRPSSLRIHMHSHTGEKPFKCPQPSCGKAFSVRSNMKRHERGCHAGGESSSMPPGMT